MPYSNGNILKGVVFLIVVILGAIGGYNGIKYYNQLQGDNSGGGQRAIMDSGEGYAKNGFLSNMGLPDINYGNPNKDLHPYIYTHYPQGMNWLAGIYTKICGPGNYGCMRIFPIIISTLALFLFVLLILSAFNPIKTLFIVMAIAIIPMTSNAMHVFQYQPYAFSLYLIELGILLNIFKKKKKINVLHFALLFFLGFLQGWFSFDYFFLASLSAVPFAMLYSSLHQREDQKRLILAIAAPCAGFGFAHFLHLLQVAFYFGSLKEALHDLIGIGLARSNANQYVTDDYGNNTVIVSSSSLLDRISLLIKYMLIFPVGKDAFFILYPIVVGITIMLIYIKESIIVIQKPILIVFKWGYPIRNCYIILAAFLVSYLWITVMYNHALYHPQFIVRHLFLLYFVCILTIIEGVSSENLSNEDTLTA